MNPIFLGIVKKGKLILNNQDGFDKYLLTLENKGIRLIVKRIKKERTLRQNKWYWSCVVKIPAEHYGYYPEEMHEAYKFMFLRRMEEGKPLTVKSTTSLSTVEFNEYIERCRQWAAEQDFVIPDPEEISLDKTD